MLWLELQMRRYPRLVQQQIQGVLARTGLRPSHRSSVVLAVAGRFVQGSVAALTGSTLLLGLAFAARGSRVCVAIQKDGKGGWDHDG